MSIITRVLHLFKPAPMAGAPTPIAAQHTVSTPQEPVTPPPAKAHEQPPRSKVQDAATAFAGKTATMLALLERYGGYVLDRQTYLDEAPGWGVCHGIDMREGLASFAGGVQIPIQALGEYHKPTGRWTWAWERSWGQHSSNLSTWLPDTVTLHARALHAFGVEHGIEILMRDSFIADMGDVHAMCMAACALFPAHMYYLNDYGFGVAAIAIPDNAPGLHWAARPERIVTVYDRLNRLFDINALNSLRWYMTALNFSVGTERMVSEPLQVEDGQTLDVPMRVLSWDRDGWSIEAVFAPNERCMRFQVTPPYGTAGGALQ